MALIALRKSHKRQPTQRVGVRSQGLALAKEVWNHGISNVGLIRGERPSTEATFSLVRTTQGVGINVSATGRRYGTGHIDGSLCVAYLVVAARNGASPSAYQSVVRKAGTLVPLQEETSGNVRMALWSGAGVTVADYGSHSAFQDRVNVFAGLITPTYAKVYANGSAPISADYALPPFSSGGTNLCFGATEDGSEVATAWTLMETAFWYGPTNQNVPTETVLYRLQRDRLQLFTPRRLLLPVNSSGSSTLSHQASLSAAIQAARSAGFSLNAALQSSATRTAVVDSAVRVANNKQAALSTAVQAAIASLASVDAAIRAARSNTASVDAAVQQAQARTASVNAAVQAASNAPASLDAAIRAARTATSVLTLYVQAGNAVVSAVDLAVLRQAAQTLGIDLAVRSSRTVTTGMSAAVRAAIQATAVLDAAIRQVRSATASLNLFVQDGNSVSAAIDVAIRRALQATSTVNAAIAESHQASLTLNAAIALRNSAQTVLNVSIERRLTRTATVSLYVQTDTPVPPTAPLKLKVTFRQQVELKAEIGDSPLSIDVAFAKDPNLRTN